METNKDIEAKEDPHLSGAYIRSLVKHLTSKDSSDGSENGECFHDVSSNSQKQPPPQQYKKQVRRRLHTTKPYQERLLNMAEARREIVTALKFHRASMKQQEDAAAAANHRHQSPPQSLFGQEKMPKSRSILSLYPPTTVTTATSTTTNSYWPMSTLAPPPPPLPPPSYYDNQNFILPSQTLGLNLNFQSFSNLDTNIYHKPMSVYNSPSSTSSSTPSSSSAPAGNPSSSTDLHHAMDGDEMEEIRSLGEQHQIEWNDTINLVTSARWCSFLKTMEIEANGDGFDGFHQFDQVMEVPPWLISANESSGLEEHFDDHFSDAYFQDPALPCMDIGEIEAMDGEWLA